MASFRLLTISILSSAAIATSIVRRHIVDCESLVSEKFQGNDINILNATSIAAGMLTIDEVSNTISFCRVFAVTPYPANNTLVYEVWLPDDVDYNGRFLAVGKHMLPLLDMSPGLDVQDI